jgi:hypothetical protein
VLSGAWVRSPGRYGRTVHDVAGLASLEDSDDIECRLPLKLGDRFLGVERDMRCQDGCWNTDERMIRREPLGLEHVDTGPDRSPGYVPDVPCV